MSEIANPASAVELVWVPGASEVAHEAGARLREFFAQGVETEYKGDVDLVTVADRTVEKLIRSLDLKRPLSIDKLRENGY